MRSRPTPAHPGGRTPSPGVLGTPGPSVTPTSLLHSVVSAPGAVYRYWRQGQAGGRLVLVLIARTVPGVIAGSARVRPGGRRRPAAAGIPGWPWPGPPARTIPAAALMALAAVVGCVGGIYGIGGGAFLAPVL